jgi:hypothetical protein
MDYREQKLEQWKRLVTNGDSSLDPYMVYAETLGVDRKTAKTKILEEIFGDNETPTTRS